MIEISVILFLYFRETLKYFKSITSILYTSYRGKNVDTTTQKKTQMFKWNDLLREYSARCNEITKELLCSERMCKQVLSHAEHAMYEDLGDFKMLMRKWN